MIRFKKMIRKSRAARFFILAAVLLSCGRGQQDSAQFMTNNAPVRVTYPKRSDMTECIDLNASTVFLKKEIMRATFQGFIERIDRNIGDEIRKGDVLLWMKTKESAADDSLRLAIGSKVFQGSIPVRAQSDGILSALYYHAGDFVSEGEEIAIISNPFSLFLELYAPYPYVSRIDLRSRCEIFLPDGRRLQAWVWKKIPSVDPLAQTQVFLLRLDDHTELPESLNVMARLPIHTVRDALVLPTGAILSNETQDIFWVMKLINDSTAVRIDIQKGFENDSLVQVISPEFNLADRIVSDGGYGLPDTARVSLTW